MIDLANKKIVVTGGSGFLGRHVVAELLRAGAKEENIFLPSHKDYDLVNLDACKTVLEGQDILIHLAAFVGGIGFNRENPGRMFYENAIMGIQLIEEARKANLEKVVILGTVCAYPKFTPVPFKEEDLWNGYPEETNAPYGIAKKILQVQLAAYRDQYQMNGIFLLPVNLYGPHDNFNPKSSHVIPALIKKVHDAQQAGLDFIEVWGTGSASREFLFVKDAARGIVMATQNYDSSEPVNLGASYEITIKDLITKIVELMDFQGEIRWDSSKPDGQPRRKLDVAKARERFGFESQVSFEDGLKETIEWYRQNPFQE